MQYEDDDRFWMDRFFFTSQDPVKQEQEKRKHPDSGSRVSIPFRRQVDYVMEQEIIPDAAAGTEELSFMLTAIIYLVHQN